MDFVKIFNISLDLSTIYFAHFSECQASFLQPVFWSEVEYKIVSFIYLGKSKVKNDLAKIHPLNQWIKIIMCWQLHGSFSQDIEKMNDKPIQNII